jgi:hypothetical protein
LQTEGSQQNKEGPTIAGMTVGTPENVGRATNRKFLGNWLKNKARKRHIFVQEILVIQTATLKA